MSCNSEHSRLDVELNRLNKTLEFINASIYGTDFTN